MTERKSVGYVALDLPRPISTNALWRPRPGGMCKTQAYKNWLVEAGLVLNTQKPGKVEGPYCLTIRLNKDSKLDLDNCSKSVSDLLQAHGVISNDRLAQQIIIKRADVPGVSVLVCSTSGGE
jgi:crossover junction endodeoxyribonuclease RusA